MAGRISFGIWGKKLSCVKRNWNKMELAVHLICINNIYIAFVKHLGIICWIILAMSEIICSSPEYFGVHINLSGSTVATVS